MLDKYIDLEELTKAQLRAQVKFATAGKYEAFKLWMADYTDQELLGDA